MTDMTNVKNLKVSITKDPEAKVSARSGKSFLSFKAVHEREDGEKVWVDCLAFGLVGKALDGKLTKGKKILVTGNVKTEEKPNSKDPGKMYVNRTLFINEAKVPMGDKLVTVDEFYTETEPF